MCASLLNKMASLASESTPQATTLRKHFSDLVRAVQDPAILAVDLYSADIITQTLLERVNSATALTTKDKTSLLLSAVSDQTVVSPDTFDTFLSILCEDHGPSLPDIVEKIKDSMLGSPAGHHPTVTRKRRHSPIHGQSGSYKRLRRAFMQAVLGGEMQGRICGKISQSVHSPFLRYVLAEQIECPKMSQSTVPVDTPSGIQSEQQAVKQHVRELETKFLALADKARQAVNLSGITLSQFCMLLTQIPASMKDEKITIRYFKENIRVFNQSSSIDEIFCHLNLYWDFLNYGLLEHIIDRLENGEFKQEMEKYKHELTAFRKATTLRAFSSVMYRKSTKVPCDLRKLVTKHDKSWMDRTLEEVEQFREKFSVKFSLSKFSLILIQIEKGSILITWWLPTAVVPHIVDQLQDPSQNAQQLWEEFEIQGLMLDGHQFQSQASSFVSPINTQGIGDMHLFDRLWQRLVLVVQDLLPMLGPNFYSILVHTSENLHSVRTILQIVLLALIWFAGVSGVVKSRFIRCAIRFTLYILVAVALLLMEEQRTALHFLAPIAHCLGCLVGTVFGLYFNRLGINAVSGCLLGIISAALIVQSIKVMFLMCGILAGLDLGLVLPRRFWLPLFCYTGWVYPVVLFTSTLFLSRDGDIGKFFKALYIMSAIIGYLILKCTHGTIYGILFDMILWLFTGFIGIVILAITKKEYEIAYLLSSIIVFSTLFATVGWYYFGLIGIPFCAFIGFFAGLNSLLSVEDKDVWENVTGNLVLCFTCRLVGAGIGSFLVPSLFSFFDLLVRSLTIGRQYTVNMVGRKVIRIKLNYDLLGSVGLSLAMLMGIGSGALLGGLCGHAVLMLANRSYDARVAGWSLMVSGSVVGALSAYSAFGLKASVPVGALFGCSITAAILLWRSGFNFKSYFQRTIQLGRVWEIFNRARMEH